VLLRRVEVRNFRRLAGPLVLDGLEEGMTVIAGDNEEGKSTLLDAIRTGLFERHNLSGRAVEAMQPFGSSVRPEIRLDFEVDGAACRITKGFAQRPSALLETPDGSFEGPAAEERLAELLTFRVPARGESKADDRGVLGLFWLEQGSAHEGLHFGETGRATLRSALEDEVGDVLGGSRGRALLTAARERRDALLTATGRPRTGGDLAEAITAAQAAEARLAELEQERAHYDEEIDALARARRELARIERDRVLEAARASLARAEEEARAIEALEREEAQAEQALRLARAERDNAATQWEARKELVASVARHEAAQRAAAEAPAALERESGAIAARLARADAALTEASARRAAAEARVRQAQTAERLGALDRDLERLARSVEQVEALLARRDAARQRAAAIAIDRERFEELQALDAALGRDRAALDAIATRLRFAPSAAQTVTRDGAPVAAGEDVRVTAPSEFRLEGFGTVRVEPGASDLGTRRARLQQAQQRFRSLLAAVGAADLAAAKAELDARAAAEAQAQEAGRLIAAHAGEGIDALRNAHAEALARRERLARQLDPEAAAAVADPDTESEALVAARDAEEAARAALDQAWRSHQQHEEELAVARHAAGAAAAALAAAGRDLQAARERSRDADLAAALDNAQRALAAAEEARQQARARLAGENPEQAALRRRNAEQALASVQAEQQRLRDASARAEARLEALGKSGIGERLEQARGEAARAAERRARLEADAQAWELLVQTLIEAERDAKEAFLGPVLARVDPFLRLVLPDARVSLDEETLEITGVEREGRAEPYARLSVGTREQLSILVRLAFAVYLRERGYPATVILDDALVYADDERFDRMQLALRKAAESVQVLILTCRPRDWRGLGAPVRRLSDARP